MAPGYCLTIRQSDKKLAYNAGRPAEQAVPDQIPDWKGKGIRPDRVRALRRFSVQTLARAQRLVMTGVRNATETIERVTRLSIDESIIPQ
jgi:hypothetical protein